MADYTDPAFRARIDKIAIDTIRNKMSDTVYFKDRDSKFIWNNVGHAMQLGVSGPDALIGKSDFDFFPKDFAQSARDTEITVMASGEPICDIIEELILDDNNVRYFMASKYPLYNEAGEIIGTWGVSKDVTEQKLLERELQRSYSKMEMLARVDDLTGLYNRRYFYEKLEQLTSLYNGREDGSTFSIVIMDVDDLKMINDQYGQLNGDIVLRNIADLLLSNTKKADTCFRIGGDEFAIALMDSDKMKALGIAKQIINSIASNPVSFEGREEKITVSAGLVTYDKENPSLSELLSVAERKVNKSKREGKNQVSF
ncbi:MAG: GGDEF domain-containing protein [Saccharofermentans sp.]|nr:GGDEF domain-containing protein [Saccharofermentans sp.]